MNRQRTIRIALVLKEEGKAVRGRAELLELLPELGMSGIAEGLATITADIDEQVFSDVFGGETRAVSSQSPRDTDFGRSGGRDGEAEAQVPAKLADYVLAVSVTPPAMRFASEDQQEAPDQSDGDGKGEEEQS